MFPTPSQSRRLRPHSVCPRWARPRARSAALAVALLMGAALAPTFVAAPALAAEPNVINLGAEKESGQDWARDGDLIVVSDTDGDGIAFVVVQGSATNGTRIVVAENTKAIVELNNAEIDLAAGGFRGARHGIELRPGSEVEVQLREGTTNVLTGAYSNGPSGGAGIFVPAGSAVRITAPGSGTGALTATGYVAMPGIGGPGGSRTQSSGDIQIDGGTIVAVAGDSAAGIGSGWRGNAGSITIKGGNVTATGGNGVGTRNGGAGIGTGSGGGAAPIKISGGTIHATGVFGAAGIGGGYSSAGVNIEITGGDITAIGDGAAAGIGSATMHGGSSKTTNLFVITGADTSINATSGRPVGDDKNVEVPAIGAADGDATRTEMFMAVGGDVRLNGEQPAKNLKLSVSNGNTGAVAMTVPEMFKVQGNQVRLVRTVNPEADFTFQTTALNQTVSFSTNGFDANPPSLSTGDLGNGIRTITFEPQASEIFTDDVEAAPSFWERNNPLMIGYVIFGVAAAVVTVLVGVYSSRRRATHYARALG